VDGRDEAGGQSRLDDVGGPARVQRGAHVVRVLMHGEKHELRVAAARFNCRAASMPSRPGMVISSTMASGWSRSASARSAHPSPIEPTTKHLPEGTSALSASIAG
jgi:hypothetical protein